MNTVNSKYKNAPLKYIDKWTVLDSSGNKFNTGRTYVDNRAYDEDFTIITSLPENIKPGQILCFENRSNLKVYISGELRKSFDKINDTGIPGGYLKEFYVTVPLDANDSGAELKIIRYKTD